MGQTADDRTAVLKYAPAAARQASHAGAHHQAAALYHLVLTFITDQTAEERAQCYLRQ